MTDTGWSFRFRTRWRWWVAAALASMSATVLACAEGTKTHTSSTERGTPQLEVDRDLIDLGDVPVAQWVTASFTLRNAGDGALRFLDAPWVKAVAGC